MTDDALGTYRADYQGITGVWLLGCGCIEAETFPEDIRDPYGTGLTQAPPPITRLVVTLNTAERTGAEGPSLPNYRHTHGTRTVEFPLADWYRRLTDRYDPIHGGRL